MMLFLSAFALGLLFNAAPGAVFAGTVRKGVRGGFKPALAVQIGSLAGDALWAVLGLLGIGVLLQIEELRLPIGLAGAVYLLWLAYDSWREASREFSIDEVDTTPDARKALRLGILLSITNPQNVAYWAALGSAMGALGVDDPSLYDFAVFFAGFMMSSVLWSFFCAALVDRLFRAVGVRWARFTYRACAIAFLILAFSLLKELWMSKGAQSGHEEHNENVSVKPNNALQPTLDCSRPSLPLQSVAVKRG